AGTAAFSLIGARPWVEANPKETELTYIKPGDPAEIRVDTYPGRSWTGRVVSISPATGAEFAVLPPQNASGNWVKVVQRVPVRIEVDIPDDSPPLSAGMSVEVSIDTGHRRRLSDLWGG
ncbi:MAG TPA: HlyD family secretion protein, partial [Magnetospirillum sp.]|nr:HlyD family secretion protein [Magnetospirillum sp.]